MEAGDIRPILQNESPCLLPHRAHWPIARASRRSSSLGALLSLRERRGVGQGASRLSPSRPSRPHPRLRQVRRQTWPHFTSGRFIMWPIYRAKRHAGQEFTWVDASSPMRRPREHDERVVGPCVVCGTLLHSHTHLGAYEQTPEGLLTCQGGKHRSPPTQPPEWAVGGALIKGTEYIFYGAYRVTYVDPQTKEEIEI